MLNNSLTAKVKVNKNKFKIQHSNLKFNNHSFLEVSKQVFYIIKNYPNSKGTINFSFGDIRFMDKAAYVLLETLIYSLVKEYDFKVKLKLNPKIGGLYSSDIETSLLYKFKTLLVKKEKYIEAFEKKSIEKNRYRVIIKSNAPKNITSKIYSDLDTFFKAYNLNEDYREEMAEAIIELIDNAYEHTDSDCLLDVDVDSNLKKNGQFTNDCYISFNVVVLNLSTTLLGDKVKNKFEKKIKIGTTETDEILKKAFKIHSTFFSEDYTETDFYNIASFQRHISGRDNANIVEIGNGGTGLTNLIEKLLLNSEDYLCYVLSGNRFIYFKNKFIKINKGGTIGFNKENNFIENVPDKQVVKPSEYTLTGTCYNLNFIKKYEEC